MCCSRCSAVMMSALHGHISDSPTLNLLYMWALSLLCPVLILNRITCSGLLSLWKLSNLLKSGCCCFHLFMVRVFHVIVKSTDLVRSWIRPTEGSHQRASHEDSNYHLPCTRCCGPRKLLGRLGLAEVADPEYDLEEETPSNISQACQRAPKWTPNSLVGG